MLKHGMIQKLITGSMLMLLIITLASCGGGSEDATARLEELEEARRQDSVFIADLQETYKKVDQSLNNALGLRAELGGMESTDDALAKVEQIAEQLQADQERINELNDKLKNASSSVSGLGGSEVFSNKEAQLNRQLKIVQDLKKQLREAKSRNMNLQELLEQAEQRVVEQDAEISDLNSTVEAKRAEIASLEKEIKDTRTRLESEKQALRSKLGATYFEVGKEFIRVAEKPGAFGGKKRENAVQNAYENLYKALEEYGEDRAKHELKKLTENKKFRKDLKQDQITYINGL